LKEEKRARKMRGEVVHRIIEVNVKVASDDESMRGGSSEREEEMEVLKKNHGYKIKSFYPITMRKTEFGLESGDDEGGRQML